MGTIELTLNTGAGSCWARWASESSTMSWGHAACRSSWTPIKMAAPRHLKMLCGNGMHLTTQGAFMLYVLSHIAPVDNKMAKAMPDKGSSSITKRNSWLVDDDADDNE